MKLIQIITLGALLAASATMAKKNAFCPKFQKPLMDTITLSGQAMHFLGLAPVEGAEISLLEAPWVAPVVTDSNGNFSIQLVKKRKRKDYISIVMKHPDFPESQTAAIPVKKHDIDNITVQTTDSELYEQIKLGVAYQYMQITGEWLEFDDSKAIVATTAGKKWASMLYHKFPHGEEGSTFTITPELPESSLGPIYFNRQIMPDLTLTETSADGGVIYVNVPAGEYILDADKAEVKFKKAIVRARGGVFINAAPPWEVKGNQE